MQSEHKDLTIILVLAVLLIPFISGALTFQKNTEVDIKIVCINAGYCSAASQCNVSVFAPNDSALLDGIEATRSASGAFHNFSLSTNQTDDLGTYRVGGFCKDGSVTQLIDFTFDVTPTGFSLSTGQAIIYIIFIAGMFFVFGLSMWGAIVLPFKNITNDTGDVVSVNDLKYIKVILMPISYVLLLFIFGGLRSVTANYISLEGVHGVFNWLFWLLWAFVFPVIITSLIFMFLVWLEQKNIKDVLERGVPFRPRIK